MLHNAEASGLFDHHKLITHEQLTLLSQSIKVLRYLTIQQEL